MSNYIDNISNLTKTYPVEAAPRDKSYSGIRNEKYLNQQEQDSFVSSSKSEKTTNKNLILKIGAGIAGSIVAGVILTKTLLKKPQKIFEIIEFKPAETIQEAEEFTRKILGIKNVDFEGNLDIANWANRGLLDIQNKIKGKWPRPKSISLNNFDDAIAYVQNRNLFINRDYIENIDKKINKVVKYLNNDIEFIPLFPKDSVSELNRLIKAYKKGELTTIDDKLKLDNLLREHHDHYEYILNNPERIISNLTTIMEEKGIKINSKTEEAIEKLKNIPTPETKEEMMAAIKAQMNGEKKSKTEMILEIINDLESEIKTKSDLQEFVINSSSSSPYDVIYHEIGHLHHRKASPIRWLKTAFSYKKNTNYLNNPTQQYLATSISNYAASDPHEFVAEVYRGLIKGTQYPKKVMELYKQFGGPIFEQEAKNIDPDTIVQISKVNLGNY